MWVNSLRTLGPTNKCVSKATFTAVWVNRSESKLYSSRPPGSCVPSKSKRRPSCGHRKCGSPMAPDPRSSPHGQSASLGVSELYGATTLQSTEPGVGVVEGL
eukprot:scaffold2161_cov225-Prasinococcus_capsulatus_cf.AAC.6